MVLHVSSYLVYTKIVQLQRLLTKLFCSIDYVIEPISVWVDRASVTQTVNLGSIAGRVKPKTRGGQSSRKIYLSRSIVTYSKMPFK